MTSDSGTALAPEQATEVGLSVAAVARRMGVAPATLRTWDRRYGVGPSDHQPGSHRRYTSGDLARLEHMRRLVIAGIPPADAARAACALGHDEAPAPSVARSGGGRVVAVPGAAQAARGLARAAQSLDTAACVDIMNESLTQRGVVWTWDNLIYPVLRGVGEQWRETGRGVETEHALSAAVQEAMSAQVRAAARPTNKRTVLLACAPGETHSLVLWTLAGALSERRIGARILGPNLPGPALASAVQLLGPAVVFVWAQITDSVDPAYLQDLPAHRPAATVLIGGPGWAVTEEDLPERVSRVTDLTDTVARIAHAVDG